MPTYFYNYTIDGEECTHAVDVSTELELSGARLILCYPNPQQAAFDVQDGSEHHLQRFNLCDMHRQKTDADAIISLTARRLKKEPVSLKDLVRRFQYPPVLKAT